MKKNNTKIIISVFCFILLGLTACSSNQKTIEGKYVSIYDKSTYLLFNKDGSVVSDMWTTIENGENIPKECFQYSIDKNNIITAVDTTEYEGQSSPTTYEIGYLYEDYICYKYDGELPISKANTTVISDLLGDIRFCFAFKEDKTYEYTVTSNGEVVNTEYGTYSTNGNKTICTNNVGTVTTFFNTDNGVLCIEYTKDN